MDLFIRAGVTSVSIADEGDPTEPVVTEAGELDESGHGLRPVPALAGTWAGDDTSRTVTATFRTDAA